jgi:HK97 family phage prohead protease
MSAQPVTLRAPEVRTYPTTHLRVVDTETNAAFTELRGRAVPYDEPTNVGWYIETIRAGAFSKSIREAARGLPLLLWHDNASWPIGVAASWDDSDDGLDGVWRLDDSDLAQRAARQARDGFLTGMSVGFQPMPNGSTWDLVDDDEWNPDTGNVDRVERVEARLLEVSMTPTPAYAGAGVSLVRSSEMPHAVVEHRRRAPGRSPQLEHWRSVVDGLRLR